MLLRLLLLFQHAPNVSKVAHYFDYIYLQVFSVLSKAHDCLLFYVEWNRFLGIQDEETMEKTVS